MNDHPEMHEDSASSIAFGNCILKIAELESAISELHPITNSDEIIQLQTELKNAYLDLASKASTKVEGWKEGPIIKERHINSSDLIL